MQSYTTNIQTLNLLKTICRMNPKTMISIDLAIVSLSYDVMFCIKKGDLDDTQFICKVPHMASMIQMFNRDKAKAQP